MFLMFFLIWKRVRCAYWSLVSYAVVETLYLFMGLYLWNEIEVWNAFSNVLCMNTYLEYLRLFLIIYCLPLKDYWNAHPEVTVLDPPKAIQQVHNRQSMLQDVADLNLSDRYGKFWWILSLRSFSFSFICLTFWTIDDATYDVQEKSVFLNSWLSRKTHHLFLVQWARLV